MAKFASEGQLQSACVVEYNNFIRRGIIWATLNEETRGKNLIGVGFVPGWPDLCEINRGHLTGIEIKLPGKRHKVAHVRRQHEIGKRIIDEGGSWFLCTSLESFKHFFDGKLTDGFYTWDEVRKLLITTKKTIAFK